MSVTLSPLEPFGLVVTPCSGTHFRELADQIAGWVKEHRVVVLRNLAAPTREELPLLARELGPLQAWDFGSVHELRVKANTENYLYTDHDVPLHWDGAFAGKAPSYLVFHCLEAPSAGGETVFVDTARVWQRLDDDEKDRFRALKLRYTTERKAHYGGSFVAALVAQHESRGDTVLRFAEPVEDLNPVRVEVEGEGPLTSARLIREIRGKLADPKAILELAWRPGDLVVADNLGLLHGRKAFQQGGPRHIRRVNVLREEKRTYRDVLRDAIRIRRPEFMLAEIPIFGLAALLADRAFELATWAPLVVLFFLLFHVGDMVNCLADRDLDLVFKPELAEAVRGLGPRNVARQIGLTAVAALALAAELSIRKARWEPLVLTALGLALGLSYSLRPLYFKGRGILQIPVLVALLFVGPMLLVWSVLVGPLTAEAINLFTAYGVMQEGIILVHTAGDLPEDRAMGIRTSAIVLGLRGSLVASAALVAVGGAVLVGWLAPRLAKGEHSVVLALLPLTLAVAVWVWHTLRVRTRVAMAADEGIGMDAVRSLSRIVPAWVTWTALATLFALAIAR